MTRLVLLLLVPALAADLPARPEALPAAPSECVRAFPVIVGQRPDVVDEKGIARCAGVLVPSSVQADLLQTEIWAEHVEATCRVELAADAERLRAAEERVAWWKGQAASRLPPWALLSIGATLGAGSTLLGAYAVSLVAE